MERNGELYCDECYLAIHKQRHVKFPRPQLPGKASQQAYSHFHNREGYTKDCWAKVKERAERRGKARKPSPEDLAAYQQWLLNNPSKGRIQ